MLALALAIGPGAPRAADFTVSNALDTGAGSLRQGVSDSNAATGPNRVLFSGLPNPTVVQLGSPLPDVAQNLTIDGTTASSSLVIRGNGTTIVSVDPMRTLTLIDVDVDMGDVVLESGATLVYDVRSTLTVDQAIRDAAAGARGKLDKRGTATLTLTGANAYTGGTTVTAGKLEVRIASLPGAADLRSGTELIFTDTADGTFAGVISGPGAVVKNGANVLTLGGSNTYTGGTTINGGRLVGPPGAIRGNMTIGSGAVLEIQPGPTPAVYSGAIGGSGLLLVSGGGELTLAPTGAGNTFTSAQVTGATLVRGAGAAISGDVQLGPTATLVIDEPGTAVFSRALSGTGTFEKDGTGTLSLTGNNAGFAGGSARVANGTLVTRVASLPVDALVQSGARLVFDQPAAASYANVVTGTGDVEKRGAGRLTFANAQTYAGTTTVSNGRLDVLGALATSGVTVASAATLGGTGTIASGVTASGRIAPGTSIGTLSANSVSFANGSVLEIEVAPGAGMNDLLAVTNAASLTGGTLELVVAPGTYSSQTATVLTAGSITGSLAFTDDFPLLDVSMTTLANAVQLTIDSNAATLASLARTRNQLAVGTVLDAEQATATGDLLTVLQGFQTLSSNELAAALDALSGETLTQLATVRLAHAGRLDRTLHGRLRDGTDTLGRRARGEGLLRELPPERAPWDLWFEPYGVFTDIEGRQGASDLDTLLAGAAFGGEWRPFRGGALAGTQVGAALAYGYGDVDFDDRDGTASAHTVLGALYGGYATERARVGASARIGYSSMQSDRTIAIGTDVRRATADFGGLDLGARVEAGVLALATESWHLEPYASVAYTHLEREAFRESGGGAVGLAVARETVDSVLVGAGTRLRGAFEIERDVWLLPELYGEWQQEVADRDRRVAARFTGQTTPSGFTARGAELARHGANAGFAWTVRTANGYEARAGYDLALGDDRFSHAVSVRIGTFW